jgi:hypothetical protein
MNGKSKNRVTIAQRDRRIFQAHLLDAPLKLPHPDPLKWLLVITEDPEIHRRMADPRGRLEWLCSFGDRRGELPEDRPPAVLAREIGLFMFMTHPGAGYLAQAAFYAVMDAPIPELMRTAVKDLSIKVGDGIAAFVDGKAWKITIDQPLTRTLFRRGQSGGEKTVAGTVWAAQNQRAVRTGLYARNANIWSLTFLLTAGDAVATEAVHLRRCAGCAGIFIADDPRQTFHSRRCATARRVSAWRTDRKLKAETKRRKTLKPKKHTEVA